MVGEDIEEVHDRGWLGERAVGDLDHVVFIFAPSVQDHGADIPLDASVVTAVFGGDCPIKAGGVEQVILVLEDQQCAEQGLVVAAIAAGDAHAEQVGSDGCFHGFLLLFFSR